MIFEFVITFIEYLCLFYLLYEKDLDRPRITVIMQALPVAVLITVMNRICPLSFEAIVIYLVYSIGIICIFYRQAVLRKILLVVLYLFLLSISEILIMALFSVITQTTNIAAEMIKTEYPLRRPYIVSVKVFLAAIVIYIKQFTARNGVFQKRIVVSGMAVASILLAFMTCNFIQIKATFGWIVYIVFFIMFSVILFSVQKWQDAENEKKLLLLQQEPYTEYLSILKTQEEGKNRLMHDMQYHCTTLHQMMINGQYQESIAYLEDILAVQKEKPILCYTGNSSIDFMLNYKKNAAEKWNIKFVIDADAIGESIPVQAKDFNIILGNLLDNAIEANKTESKEDKWIYFKINLVKCMILITVENSFSVMPVKKHGNFISQKKDSAVHGLGIKNIIDQVDKYHGLSSFETQGNRFIAKVTLFLEEE